MQLALELAPALEALGRERRPPRPRRATAQPGSPSCVQSLKRQSRGELLDVGERRRRSPAALSASWSSRRPGVSMTIPPPGSRISSRWLVVCRPSSSSARVSPVAIRSLPAKRLTSVDLPTPLEPSSTAVTPGAIRARSSSHPSPGLRADDVHGHAGRHRLDLGDVGGAIVDAVGLRQHDLRARAALPDRDEVALDPARLELGAERGDDEGDVDVRDERLHARRPAGRVAHDRAAPRQHRVDDAVGEPDPVADRDVRPVVGEATRDARRAACRPRWRRRARRGGR